MTDPIIFESTSPRFALPLLHVAQSQKELFVNEAFAITDALLHGAIEGTAATPPSNPANGSNWIVAASASGDWAGQDGKIAARQGGNWLFIVPRDGLQLLNRVTGQSIRYAGGWKMASLPTAPAGGTTVDTEVRAALASLIAKLQVAGVFPSN